MFIIGTHAIKRTAPICDHFKYEYRRLWYRPRRGFCIQISFIKTEQTKKMAFMHVIFIQNWTGRARVSEFYILFIHIRRVESFPFNLLSPVYHSKTRTNITNDKDSPHHPSKKPKLYDSVKFLHLLRTSCRCLWAILENSLGQTLRSLAFATQNFIVSCQTRPDQTRPDRLMFVSPTPPPAPVTMSSIFNENIVCLFGSLQPKKTKQKHRSSHHPSLYISIWLGILASSILTTCPCTAQLITWSPTYVHNIYWSSIHDIVDEIKKKKSMKEKKNRSRHLVDP